MSNLGKAIALSLLGGLFLCSCATAPTKRLTYLASKRPQGVIATKEHKEFQKNFPRGGFYFFNHNFRPAADVGNYIEQSHKEAGVEVLRDVDVELNVPFAFDILFFGYNGGTDYVLGKRTVAEKTGDAAAKQ